MNDSWKEVEAWAQYSKEYHLELGDYVCKVFQYQHENSKKRWSWTINVANISVHSSKRNAFSLENAMLDCEKTMLKIIKETYLLAYEKLKDGVTCMLRENDKKLAWNITKFEKEYMDLNFKLELATRNEKK